MKSNAKIIFEKAIKDSIKFEYSGRYNTVVTDVAQPSKHVLNFLKNVKKSIEEEKINNNI